MPLLEFFEGCTKKPLKKCIFELKLKRSNLRRRKDNFSIIKAQLFSWLYPFVDLVNNLNLEWRNHPDSANDRGCAIIDINIDINVDIHVDIHVDINVDINIDTNIDIKKELHYLQEQQLITKTTDFWITNQIPVLIVRQRMFKLIYI